MSKKVFPPVVVLLSVVYYYLTIVSIPVNVVQFQYILIGLVVFLTFFSTYRIVLNELLCSRVKLMFFVVCIAATIIMTSPALLIMLCIGMSYYSCFDKKVRIRRMLKHIAIASSACFVLTCALGLLGILENKSFPIFYASFNAMVYSLGFQNPNGVLMCLLPIISSVALLASDKKRKLSVMVILLGISFFFFIVSGSRNGLIVILAVLVVCSLSDGFLRRIKRSLMRIPKYLFPIFTLLTFGLILIFGATFHNPVNILLSFRPYRMHDALVRFIADPIWISGREIDGFPVDNMYAFILLSYGVVTLLIYCYVFYQLFKLEKSPRIILVGVFMLVYGVFEKFTIMPVINIFLPLAMVSYLDAAFIKDGMKDSAVLPKYRGGKK